MLVDMRRWLIAIALLCSACATAPVRAQRNTECRTSINVGSRDDDACVASKPVIRLVVSSPVGRCERHTHPSSEYRVRGRGR